MLPRDISLEDAILDLVDNCVDGAMRMRKATLRQKAPFKGYFAKLTLSASGFEITDNCGGIPKEYVAAAFSLGRPSVDQDRNLPTIGMYGIGMKRAVFKLGREALVQSNSSDGFFEVCYTKTWMKPDNEDWDLPITRSALKKRQKRGVTIIITDLRAEIAKQFRSKAFANRLKEKIREHFGYLIHRGFKISVNNESLTPKTLHLKYVAHSREDAIRPYDYETTIKGVDIKVTVGFFRALARDREIEEELDGPRSKDSGGVTVVCNDRVVLLGDQSIKTGWGDGGVPRYHPQFRTIAGLIVFSSADASQLPISTTKRDLDVDTEVYFRARKSMVEGLKSFTNFTNKWKGMEDDTDQYFSNKSVDAKTQVTLAKKHGKRVRGEPAARKYVPALPLPKSRDPRRRISFLRKESEIKVVSEYLFDEPGQKPSIVGEECFDQFFDEAKKNSGYR